MYCRPLPGNQICSVYCSRVQSMGTSSVLHNFQHQVWDEGHQMHKRSLEGKCKTVTFWLSLALNRNMAKLKVALQVPVENLRSRISSKYNLAAVSHCSVDQPQFTSKLHFVFSFQKCLGGASWKDVGKHVIQYILIKQIFSRTLPTCD